jgi:hypothetical protein
VLVLQTISAGTRRAIYPYAQTGSDLPNAIVARYFRIGLQIAPYTVLLRKSEQARPPAAAR